jgi:DNA damage-binding protein 1
MEEYQIIDMAFLHGCIEPTIALIHQENNGRRFKTYQVAVWSNSLLEVSMQPAQVPLIMIAYFN